MEKHISGAEQLEFDVGGTRENELFDVLSNPRRRYMLHSLQTTETPVSVKELTAKIATWEAQQSVADHSGDGGDAIEISLVHNHLPKMAEAELVEYDDTQQRVTLADRAIEVRSHLQTMASD